MKRVQERFGAKGVRFWFVYANATETEAGIRGHQRAYSVGDQVLIDSHSRLAEMTGAQVTPEAAVLVPDGAGLRTVWVGRVDDQYLRIGQERPRATRHDLEEAVTAVLAGNAVPKAGGPAVGCGIVRGR